MELCELTLHEAVEALARRETSARELVESCLQRIERTDGRINAFITLTPEHARIAADEADRRRERGEPMGPLAGLPLGLKDIFVTQGVRTTCGSRLLEDFVPPYDGTAVLRIKEAGLALLGKLNLDEFAMGSSNENSSFGPVHNPWNLSRVPGGSSGGSAAAVSAGMVLAALGTDTGGSVRQPAALCGITGLKPTYGRISRYGIIAFASSLDQVGVLAHDVRDCALLLNTLAGRDPLDATSADVVVPDHTAALEQGVAGLRLGVPKEYFGTGLDAEVERLVREAVAELHSLGAELVEVSLPHSEYAVAAYYLIAPAEASSNLARYDGLRFGRRVDEAQGLWPMIEASRGDCFGREVKRRIMLGTYALCAGYQEAFYQKAMKVRTLIQRDFREVFGRVDALVCPTSPVTAFALGERVADPLAMYLADVYTVPASLAGLPGLSVPCGLSKDSLPVGLQILGKPFDEPTVLRIGRAYEREHGWHRWRPRT